MFPHNNVNDESVLPFPVLFKPNPNNGEVVVRAEYYDNFNEGELIYKVKSAPISGESAYLWM